MQDLTQTQWREQITQDDNALILDVRTDMEVEEGMIPNAEQINIQDAAGFMEKAKALDASKNYYVYCRSGARSGQACSIMNQLGFENAYNLLGGFNEWDGDVASI